MPAPKPLPEIATQPLSIVLLARNADGHLEAMLQAWLDYLDARGQAYEVLVSDDGSSDGTAELAKAVAAKRAAVRVLRQSGPRGEGAALRSAIAEAKNPLLFVSLLRPEYRPEHLALLLDRPATEPMKGKEIDNCHLIGCYRAGVPMPSGLRALGFLWRLFCRVVYSCAPAPLPGWLGWRRHAGWLLSRILFALRYHDVACPVRLMRREMFARIPIQSDSSFAHVEVLAKANFLEKYMAEEVPLDVVPPPYGGDWPLLWRDGKKVFRHPDFGPAHNDFTDRRQATAPHGSPPPTPS